MNIDDYNYLPIKDFDKYYITDCGKVISFKFNKPKIMKTTHCKKGYEYVKLSKNNKTYHKAIHRLVGFHFINNPHNKPEIHHKDNNPSNNNVLNLEWVTRKENLEHSYKTLPPTRNFVKCFLVNEEGNYKKSFNSKKDACDFASENFGCSNSSMVRYGKSGKYRIIENL